MSTDDDKTPALGVPLGSHATVTADCVGLVPPVSDAIDPNLGIPVKDLNLLDALFHEAGMLAAEDPRANTPEEQALDDEIYAAGLEIMKKSPDEVRAMRDRARTRRRT